MKHLQGKSDFICVKVRELGGTWEEQALREREGANRSQPALPCLGRIQAPGAAAAGEEPLAAVREHRPAHLQQRPER